MCVCACCGGRAVCVCVRARELIGVTKEKKTNAHSLVRAGGLAFTPPPPCTALSLVSPLASAMRAACAPPLALAPPPARPLPRVAVPRRSRTHRAPHRAAATNGASNGAAAGTSGSVPDVNGGVLEAAGEWKGRGMPRFF